LTFTTGSATEAAAALAPLRRLRLDISIGFAVFFRAFSSEYPCFCPRGSYRYAALAYIGSKSGYKLRIARKYLSAAVPATVPDCICPQFILVQY
jgi:hypothetical protein